LQVAACHADEDTVVLATWLVEVICLADSFEDRMVDMPQNEGFCLIASKFRARGMTQHVLCKLRKGYNGSILHSGNESHSDEVDFHSLVNHFYFLYHGERNRTKGCQLDSEGDELMHPDFRGESTFMQTTACGWLAVLSRDCPTHPLSLQ
jgi:hypothetical protein